MTWVPPRLGVIGGGTFPVRHIWCVGRNYAEHVREMGAGSCPESPIFFSKPSQAAVLIDEVPYPDTTRELHHEVELVVALGGGGSRLDISKIPEIIFGYGVGVDLTRRDVQAVAKKAGNPWELSKGFDGSAPVGPLVSSLEWQPEAGREITLLVNGQTRQSGRLGDMLWPVEALLADLSRTVTLGPGDLVFTGTPAGVGVLVPGDRVEACIEGLPVLEFRIAPG